ncbi:ArnT family glycosyltransferase [Xanthomonas indica]|uniref:Glycosyltransferase family 39 protein n=1 Tax=Xanthomonas indica TaxID=2912242 RepID=A0AAU8I8V4_9XANT|nr:glycosyltransferase family 39 protein [Xanthomonas indica]MCI2261674.1 glycosyltransferase family 39 protein [Xanthomonas indica]
MRSNVGEQGGMGMWQQRWSRPRPIQVVVALIVSALLLICWNAFQADPRYATQLQAEAIHTDGFGEDGSGFRATGAGRSHMLMGQFKLEPGQRYGFSFSVDASPGGPADIVVDLFGPGYDNPAQERSFGTQPGQASLHWADTMDVGENVPDTVFLRIFYDGPAGLHVSDIRVVQVPKWRIWVGYLLTVILLAAIVMFAALVARWTYEEVAAEEVRVPCSLLVALWLGCAFVRFMVVQMLPYWSGDEYLYKMIAAGIWAGGGRSGIPMPEQILHATNMPNMLYPYLIAPSFMAGDGFYTGIRLINALVVTAAIFPVYLMARRFIAGRLSLLVALAAVALPSIFISAYAATEVLYFPLYLWACWAGLRYLERPDSWAASLLFGFSIGMVLNVRLNGVTVLLALVATMAIVSLKERNLSRFITRPTWLLAVVASYVAFKLVSVSLASPATDGLGMYGNRLHGWRDTIISDLPGFAGLLLGHLTILAIPFSLSLAAGIGFLIAQRNHEMERVNWKATLFMLMATAAAIGMAIVFTIGIAPSDLGGLGRWHSRYYFSSFPLLLILMFKRRPKLDESVAAWGAYWAIIAVVMTAAVLFLMVLKFHLSPWFGSTVDSMEAQLYRSTRCWFVGLGLLLLLVAAMRDGVGRRALQLLLLGAWLLASNAATWRELSRSPGAFDARCSALAEEIIAHSPGGVAVVASGRRELVDNAFWLPYLPVAMRMLPNGGVVDAQALGQVRYVLADDRIEVTHATRIPDTGTCSIYKVN